MDTDPEKSVDTRDPIHAVVHMDLDGCAHIYRMHGWQYEKQDDPLFETGMRNALNFFDDTNVRATLFVIAEDLNNPHKRSLLQEAVDRGHEIASHSLTHHKLTTLNRDEKKREIFESRERLAAELGVEVSGFRAPGFGIDRECLEFVDEAGYLYDSSLFPNRRFRGKIGVDQLSQVPYHPFSDRQLVELPLPRHKPLPVPFHPCYSLVLGTWYFRLGLQRFRQTGAPLVLLFHLTDLADALPSSYLQSWRATLFTLSQLGSARKLQRCTQMIQWVQREYEIINTNLLCAKYSGNS